MEKYPVINLSKDNLKPGSDLWIRTRKNVRHALEEHGFFVAVQNHISSELSTRVFEEMEKMFALPKETKASNVSENFEYFGYQTANPKTFRLQESMSIEDSTSLSSFHKFANLICPSATGNNVFCEVMHSFAKKACEMEQMVSRMIFESYGLDKYYEPNKDSRTYILRMMKYLVASDPEEGEIGANVHTDKGFITILHQNQVNGLQFKPKHGGDVWVSVDLPPRSLVVFAGDAFSAWSNGRIHAVVHRVVLRGKETRYSLAQFSFSTKMVQVPEEMVDDEHPLQFKPFDNFGLLIFYASLEGRHVNNLLKAYCGI